MKLTEIHDIIQTGHPAQWNEIDCWGANSGPSYRIAWDKGASGGEWELYVKQHGHIAAYKPDVALTIAWSMRVYDTGPQMTPEWLAKFPLEDSVEYYMIDTFWTNALVDRNYYAVVDSRAYVPLPVPYYTRSGPGEDAELERYEVTRHAVALTRLAHILGNHRAEDFDQTLDRAGFVVVDDYSE